VRAHAGLTPALALALLGVAGEARAATDGGGVDAVDAGASDALGVDAGSASDAADDASSDEPRAPELATPVVAEYPEAALAARLEASVVVKVDVDVEGRVTEATIARPAGNEFDEAARAAALRARFRPGRRGGRAVASRISIRIDFHPPPVVVQPEVQPVAPPPRPPALALPAPPQPVDVSVRGESAVERRRHSAEAVTIVELERAKREAADMGEVLARTEGVVVRQQGGLGSYTRISINGLIDDQVRYFLDGVPLELSGYPFGIANVPVNLIQRVEIYKGVLPIRFAADALGGAFNLVTDQDFHGSKVGVSYKVGSFETHRVTVTARHLHEPTGFFVRASGFHDYALNDYRIDVDVPNAEGQLSPARVYKSHDKYRATGGNVEFGFIDRSWAKRLLVRAFVTDYDKQYAHNYVMTVPYGGVTYGERISGVSLRYEQTFGQRLTLEAVAAYAYLTGRFQDLSSCVFDWYGRCVRERRMPGELDGRPHDQVFWGHADYVRAYLTWRASQRQAVRLALMPPRIATRTGDERREANPESDKLNSVRRLVTMINGIEHQVDLVDGRLENIAFAKQYLQLLLADEVGAAGPPHRDRSTLRWGIGDGLRYRVGQWLWLKASYEWATRLPRPDEVFGDNAFVLANIDLQPETTHNGNLGFQYDRRDTRFGTFAVQANAFARLSKNMIVLITQERTQIYRNVYGSRSVGIESKAGWTSPRNLLVLEGNFTWQDFRNTSSQGAFGAFEGDRIPNRPYLDGYGMARLQLQNVMAPRDEISLYWMARYVHSFFRSWESVGDPDFKQTIPSQLVQTVGAGYFIRNDTAFLSVDLEYQNITDERVYDLFGAQKPGRGVFVKTTAEF
jgi:TonB family protein